MVMESLFDRLLVNSEMHSCSIVVSFVDSGRLKGKVKGAKKMEAAGEVDERERQDM